MRIVCLKTEDLDAAMALYSAVRTDFPALSPESFREALSRNLSRGSVFGVWGDGALAGLLVCSPPLSRISFLAVHPGYRRRGIAGALMKHALALFGGKAELFTYAPKDGKDTPALALYRSLGFREAGRAPDFAVPAVRMVCEEEAV